SQKAHRDSGLVHAINKVTAYTTGYCSQATTNEITPPGFDAGERFDRYDGFSAEQGETNSSFGACVCLLSAGFCVRCRRYQDACECKKSCPCCRPRRPRCFNPSHF